MKVLSISFLMAIMLIFACKQPQKTSETGEKFGKEITSENTVDMGQVLSSLMTQDSVKIKMKATVENVCQVKGCWMNLVSGEEEKNQKIFVKFKDYAFFMPLDISGKEVIVEGVAYKEITSVDELKHYAEDEGKSAEEIAKITEPVEEFKIMADGVIIL